MISALTLDRFRGYRSAHLQLKPLTVLLGANSAGKSSYLHALAALHFIRYKRISPASLLPRVTDDDPLWPFDFGSRDDLQTHGTLSEGGIGIEVVCGTSAESERRVRYEFGRPGEPSLDLSGFFVDKGFEVSGAMRAATVAVPGTTIRATMRTDADSPRPEQPTTGTINLGEPASISVEPRGILIRQASDGSWVDADGLSVNVSFENLELKHYFRDTTLLEVSPDQQKPVLAALDGIRYLRAARARPRRQFYAREPNLDDDDVGVQGQWTAATLEKLSDLAVEEPEFVPEKLDLRTVRQVLSRRTLTETMSLASALDRWSTRMAMGEQTTTDRRGDALRLRVTLADGQPRALPDLGFGVSQVLPLLVQGLALPQDGTLLVEQPEAQLHPRPQALLADFFCSIVQRGRNVLVETHSEAFFRRLHLRTMLDPDLASKVAVYFLHASDREGCSVPDPVALGRDFQVEWPRGFLTEGVSAQSSYAAARAALADRESRPR